MLSEVERRIILIQKNNSPFLSNFPHISAHIFLQRQKYTLYILIKYTNIRNNKYYIDTKNMTKLLLYNLSYTLFGYWNRGSEAEKQNTCGWNIVK